MPELVHRSLRDEAHQYRFVFGPGVHQEPGQRHGFDVQQHQRRPCGLQLRRRAGGFWTVFFRVNTNGNAANDSLFYRVNGSSWETVTGLSSLGTGWRWAQAASLFPVAGPTTLEIANRETGLEIDKIALLNSGDPVPTGTGAPAYNCPVTMYFEAECPTTASGAYPFKRFLTKTGYSGAGYLYSQGNNTGSATSSTDIAIFPFDAGTSTYSFYFRVDTNGSANDDSWFYRVDSGAWTTMNNITNATGWRWVQGTATAALTIGRHALEVRNREDGLNIDKIAFIPSGGAAPSGSGGTSVNCDPAPTMSGWGFWEQTDYATTHQRYFEAEGAMVIDMHVDWHHNNDPGGRGGLGSGIAFLGMHRAMVNDFPGFRSQHRAPELDSNRHERTAAVCGERRVRSAADGGPHLLRYLLRSAQGDRSDEFLHPALPHCERRPGARNIVDVDISVPRPRYGPAYWAVWSKLGDIPDLDTLGRIMGESFFHDELHNYISGTMGTLGSPAGSVLLRLARPHRHRSPTTGSTARPVATG